MENLRTSSSKRRLSLGLVTAVVLLNGCAHTVKIISVPDGATVSINGKVVGTAPLIYQERSGPPGISKEIKVELAGHSPVIKKESKKICPTPGNLLLDSLGIGFFFGFCLRDEYILDLTEAKGTQTPQSEPPPISSAIDHP